jgi:very-short-patch-repair endonuclease
VLDLFWRRKDWGVEFQREVQLDKFIVDFYCHELMLALKLTASLMVRKKRVRGIWRDRKGWKVWVFHSFGFTIGM